MVYASPWEKRLMCEISTVTCNIGCRSGDLFLPPGQNCNMAGAIEMFKSIAPAIVLIRTWSGGEPDTFYMIEDGEWVAKDPARTRRGDISEPPQE